MARYRFVQLVRRQTEISSTDPSVIDWVVESVRKYIPSCDTRNHVHDLMGDVSVCVSCTSCRARTIRWHGGYHDFSARMALSLLPKLPLHRRGILKPGISTFVRG